MPHFDCNLNIWYSLSKEIWDKVPSIYEKMEGWLGYSDGIPYWFSFEENQKSIFASVEESGLYFEANMEENEWLQWKTNFKKIATETLGFKVGEIEEGEVDYQIEWIK